MATWRKPEKLKSRKRIERVFREGKSFSVFPYKVVFLLAATPVPGAAPLQAGFGAAAATSKKPSTATASNAWAAKPIASKKPRCWSN